MSRTIEESGQAASDRTSWTGRREGHYGAQRSRPNSTGSRLTGGSGIAPPNYQEPDDYNLLGGQAEPIPVDAGTGGQPDLEQSLGRPGSRASSYARDEMYQQGNFRSDGTYELSEVSAPPPATDDAGRDRRQQHLRDTNDTHGGSSGGSHATGQKKSGDYVRRRGQPPPVSHALTELYTVSYLIFFSILGTLARLGVQWLTFFPGAPIVTPVIWANFGGSFIMGFLAEDQGLFRDGSAASRKDHNDPAAKAEARGGMSMTKRKKTIPLYIGLATGFCGSFTSFSSFARDIFLALSNNLPTPVDHPYPNTPAPSTTSTLPRNGGYAFEALLHIIIATLALSLGALITGAQLATFLNSATPTLPQNFIRRILDRIVVVLAFGSWLGAILLTILPPDRPSGPASRGSWANETWRGQALFALVFAPPGCLLRFYSARMLNGLVPSFPLGTFAANMLGTALLGMCFDIQHVGVGVMGMAGGGRTGCQVLQGVMDGFCGCLTTVSTWVAEINGLKRRHGWIYAATSVIVAFCLLVVIMGSVRWSVGFSAPACNTGYPDKING